MLKKSETKKINSINTPWKIQKFVDSLDYHTGKRISVIEVLRTKKADCLEAACFALFALRKNGFKSFLVDLSAVRDEDHVICVFKANGLYGAVAKSKFLNLRYRNPVYKTIRELVMSYFDNYFNYKGYFSLRSFSKMPLQYLKEDWILEAKEIIKIEKRFSDIKHENLVPRDIKLTCASKLKLEREAVIYQKDIKSKKMPKDKII